MSRLMRICRHWGAEVSGVDREMGPALARLAADGYRVEVGHRPDWARNCDMVVYTSAVPPDDPDRVAAPCQMERAELLGLVAGLYPTVVAVAGTHGKTTTCGMIASILEAAGIPFCAHIGGEGVDEVAEAHLEGDILLTEACEYRRHFLSLHPTVGVVTGVEHDHPDCYANADEVWEAFAAFGANCRTLVSTDRRLICSAAHTNTCVYDDVNIRAVEGQADTYMVRCMGEWLQIGLHVWGEFNMRNAAYAAAAATLAGASREAVREGLERYRGAKRRQQVLGRWRGAVVLSDYAHHPTEIYALTKAARARYGRIAVIFEPHTYSRTKALLAEFARAFVCDTLYLLPTFAAREAPENGVDEALWQAVEVRDKYRGTWEEIRAKIEEKTPHEKYGAYCFVGAGKVDTYANLLAALEQKQEV